MKIILTVAFVLTLSCCSSVFAQDLSKSRVALVSFTAGINDDVLDGLDPRNITKIPYTSEEKNLQARISKRVEKFFLDDAYNMLQKRLEEKGIQLEPLSTTDKVAILNDKGYPSPLIAKNVIKKKNDDYADYFLSINIVCSKPFVGGLLGFKPESRIRLVLFDGSGGKVKTINKEVKDSVPVKNTDFDEEWTGVIERFNRMDWYSVVLLEERLLPLVEEVIIQALDEL